MHTAPCEIYTLHSCYLVVTDVSFYDIIIGIIVLQKEQTLLNVDAAAATIDGDGDADTKCIQLYEFVFMHPNCVILNDFQRCMTMCIKCKWYDWRLKKEKSQKKTNSLMLWIEFSQCTKLNEVVLAMMISFEAKISTNFKQI